MVIGAASSQDLSTLLGFSRFLAGTLSNVSAVGFTDANITALLNIEYRETQAFLLSQVMYDWKENTLEGTGNGLINLTASDNSYTFPADLVTIDRVEINYTGATNGWVPVNLLKQETIDQALANTSNNAPIRGSTSSPIAWARDGVLYIDPIPSQTVTGGLKVYCTILVTDLLVGGTGDQLTPVFSPLFHQILSYGAAVKYLLSDEQFSKAQGLMAEKGRIMAQMVDFYSKRDADSRPTLTPRVRQMQ